MLLQPLVCPSPGHLPEKGADSARSSVLRGFEDVCVGWIMAWALSKCILYIVVVHTSEANISNISPTMSYIYKTNSIFHVLMSGGVLKVEFRVSKFYIVD